MVDIILALGQPSLLSESTQPPTRYPDLPLTPPTSFHKTLLTTLPSTPLPQSTLHIAEPPISFPDTAKTSILHAANRASLSCRFYTAWQCVNAILPCTVVLDVSRGDTIVIYDAVTVEVCERDDRDIAYAIAGLLLERDLFDRSNPRVAVVGVLREGENAAVCHAWGEVVKEERFKRLRNVNLTFVGCEFDNSVLVWVGAAVFAAKGEDKG